MALLGVLAVITALATKLVVYAAPEPLITARATLEARQADILGWAPVTSLSTTYFVPIMIPPGIHVLSQGNYFNLCEVTGAGGGCEFHTACSAGYIIGPNARSFCEYSQSTCTSDVLYSTYGQTTGGQTNVACVNKSGAQTGGLTFYREPPTLTATPTPTPTPPSSTKSKVPVGAVAGGAIGGVIAIGAAIGLIIMVLLKHKRASNSGTAQDDPVLQAPTSYPSAPYPQSGAPTGHFNSYQGYSSAALHSPEKSGISPSVSSHPGSPGSPTPSQSLGQVPAYSQWGNVQPSHVTELDVGPNNHPASYPYSR